MHVPCVAFALVIAGFIAVPAASAQSHSQANDEPFVTIRGAIDDQSGLVRLSRSTLEELGMVTVQTSTPFSDGVLTFEGISMELLAETLGATGQNANVVALNDYSSDIPVTDFAEYGTILAIKRDGAYMPVSNWGPFAIIYPFDSYPELNHQKFYSRSVWQVETITFE